MAYCIYSDRECPEWDITVNDCMDHLCAAYKDAVVCDKEVDKGE